MKTLLYLSPPIILLVLFVVILLFGGSKIPELFKGIGKGIKGFKEEMGEGDDNKKLK